MTESCSWTLHKPQLAAERPCATQSPQPNSHCLRGLQAPTLHCWCCVAAPGPSGRHCGHQAWHSEGFSQQPGGSFDCCEARISSSPSAKALGHRKADSSDRVAMNVLARSGVVSRISATHHETSMLQTVPGSAWGPGPTHGLFCRMPSPPVGQEQSQWPQLLRAACFLCGMIVLKPVVYKNS